jgi:hypothetical protein
LSVLCSTNCEHLLYSSLPFTDEARFGRDGVINIHNKYQCAGEHSHGVICSRHQHKSSALMCGQGLLAIGRSACFFTSAYHCQNFILHDLPKLLKNIPVAVKSRTWYMHDGALAPFSLTVRDVLNITHHY